MSVNWFGELAVRQSLIGCNQSCVVVPLACMTTGSSHTHTHTDTQHAQPHPYLIVSRKETYKYTSNIYQRTHESETNQIIHHQFSTISGQMKEKEVSLLPS